MKISVLIILASLIVHPSLAQQQPVIVLQSGHQQAVSQMHYRYENGLLATLATDNIRPVTFKIWDVKTRKLMKDISLPQRRANNSGNDMMRYSQGSGSETFDFVNGSMLKIFHNDTIPNKITMLNLETDRKSTFVAEWVDDFFTTENPDEILTVKVLATETWVTLSNTRTSQNEPLKFKWAGTSPKIAYDNSQKKLILIGDWDYEHRDKIKLAIIDLKSKTLALDTIVQKEKTGAGFTRALLVRPLLQKIMIQTFSQVFVLDYSGKVIFSKKEKTDEVPNIHFTTLHPNLPLLFIEGSTQESFWNFETNTLIRKISEDHVLNNDFRGGEFVEHERNIILMNKIPYVYNIDTDVLQPFNSAEVNQNKVETQGFVSMTPDAFYFSPSSSLGATVFSWSANGLLPRKYNNYPRFGTSTASQLFRFKYYDKIDLEFFPKDSVYSTIQIYNRPNFEKLRTVRLSSELVPVHKKDTYIVHVFDDGKRIVYREGNTYQELDLDSKKKLRRWTWKDVDHENYTRTQQIHWVNDEPFVSSVSNTFGSKSTIVNVKTGKVVYEKVHSYKPEDNVYNYPTFRVSGQFAVSTKIASGTWSKSITALEVFDFVTGTLKTISCDFDIHTFHMWAINKNMLLVSTLTGEIYAWSLNDGKFLKRWLAHNSYISSISFSSDDRFILSQDAGGLCNVWKADDFSFQLGLYVGKSTGELETMQAECLFFTPEGHYFSPKSLLQMLAFRADGRAFPVEQFDLKFNRPDKVLEKIRSMGMTGIEQSQIDYYKKSYQKRLSLNKMNEDQLASDFHLPNTPNVLTKIPFTVQDKNLSVEIQIEDSQEKLTTLFATVNGVPAFGSKGLSLKNPSQQSIEKIQLTLSSGKNVIEFSVLNNKGVESLKERIEVNYSTNETTRKIHLVTIGVSQYQDNQRNLTYASKDAQDIQNFISKNYPDKNAVEIVPYSLVDAAVTKSNVIALKTKLLQSTVDDVVLVFFSGHGVLDKNLNYFLATHTLNFSNPTENGLAYEDLEELLDGIPARQKVLMIDACHSGELDKEEIEVTSASASTGGMLKFRDFGAQIKNKTIGLQNSFELCKQLFSDLRKTNGTTVISAASGVEYAIEGEQWQNGVFTYALLSGLQEKKADLNNDGAVYLSELQKYLQIRVPELTQGKQTPTSRAENTINDFRIW